MGTGFTLLSSRAKIYIGDDVMFGPGVTVVTGDHRTDIFDCPMTTVTDNEKLSDNDKDGVFEGGNWIGANAIILKGVTVGKGRDSEFMRETAAVISVSPVNLKKYIEDGKT